MQTVIVLIVFVAAVAFMVKRLRTTLGSNSDSSCSTGCGCSKPVSMPKKKE